MHSSKPHRISCNSLHFTGSVQHSRGGEVFATSVDCAESAKGSRVRTVDWLFDWHSELGRKDRQVLKIELFHEPSIIQGLVSLTDKGDHIYMHLIENASWNKGKNKLYCGVAGNLVAAACKLSFDLKYDGIVSFVPKTQLIEHYQKTLGAKLFGSNRMFIDTREAMILVKNYLRQTI
ncbi:MAG: hypothetical protein BGO21_18710 [Dyadobacter sp. 50-39]|uniref:hypothetical protein n=1 Tax=Dyadobacter sp. 50-39 TaxID=1895756 RepID=UPI0009694090|nr:hypothetical protein [Dyadobacter sp. 50-39]OJV14731.1 MAG: hypothetical protein BGO21_18710 [Dyadobacter sp. 50-39]